jgi:uncharacterized protein
MWPRGSLAAVFLLFNPLTIYGFFFPASSRSSISPVATPKMTTSCSSAAADASSAAAEASSSAAVSISSSNKYFTVGITGSSGLVGTALRAELAQRLVVNGQPVRLVRLIRGDAPEKLGLPPGDVGLETTTLIWNPHGETADQVMDLEAAAQMDAIVHLAGESVATGGGFLGLLRPWTRVKKDEILHSRIGPTRALAKVMAAVASSSSRPKSLLVASGIGIYGDTFLASESDIDDPAAADESYNLSMTRGFLADVSRQWEAASALTSEDHLTNSDTRVVQMRLGVVLSKRGGALAKLYPIFRLGGGGTIGAGRQYLSFISARDAARAMIHLLETPLLHGPVNLAAPFPCTNQELTHALGACLHRPTILPFPAWAVQLLLGEMGQEMLLGGTRAVPRKLLESGFKFHHATIQDAIRSALQETI